MSAGTRKLALTNAHSSPSSSRQEDTPQGSSLDAPDIRNKLNSIFSGRGIAAQPVVCLLFEKLETAWAIFANLDHPLPTFIPSRVCRW